MPLEVGTVSTEKTSPYHASAWVAMPLEVGTVSTLYAPLL